nr:hypothetical protein [Tanacetum cinerariifolium]
MMFIFKGSRPGPKRRRTYIPREREDAEQRLINDYFGDDEFLPKYPEEIFKRRALEFSFELNGYTCRKSYYLTDGIDPSWSTFVNMFFVAMDEKTLKFKRVQESARKDIERPFGVLQGHWEIIRQPARAYQINALKRIIATFLATRSSAPVNFRRPPFFRPDLGKKFWFRKLPLLRFRNNGLIVEASETDVVKHIMAPSTRQTSGRNNGEELVTKQYVDDAMAEIRQTLVAMDSTITVFKQLKWCEHFFLIDNTPPKEKVRIILVYLSDKALLWHIQCIKTMGENVSWDGYKEAIIQRFVLVFKDPMVELKNANNKPPLLPLPSANSISNPNPTTALKSPVRKYLTQKEYEEIRAKNLCFYCDKKFVPGHKCKGQLFALVVLPMKEFEEEFEDAQKELDELENEELPQISLNAFNGASSFHERETFVTDVLLLPLGGCEMVLAGQKQVHRMDHAPQAEIMMMWVSSNTGINLGPLEKIEPHEMPVSNRHLLTQKNVIQARVKELCEAGVIHQKHSPFASFVVQVNTTANFGHLKFDIWKWPQRRKRKMSRVLCGVRRCLLHTYQLAHSVAAHGKFTDRTASINEG